MLLSNFITNPTSRIIIFILFLLPAIIVVNFFSLSFFYFAAYAIVISILFPIYFYTLDQSAVDFWYYTLGILGVVILFSSQSLVAKTYELSNLMVQAKERSNFLDELSDDIYTTLVSKNGHNLRFELLELLEAKKINFDSVLRNCQEQSTISNEQCIVAESKVSAINKLLKADVIENQLLEIEAEVIESIFKDEQIRFQGVNLPAITVVRLLNPSHQNQAINELTLLIDQTLDFRNEWLVNQIFKIEEKFGVISTMSRFFSAIWPYLLCIALCMKLARNRYIERI
jgi:hypothetical protein